MWTKTRMVAAAILLATAGIVAGPAAGQETLRIAVFGGAWQDAIQAGVVKNFEDATGAKVVAEATAYNEIVAKLKAGGGKNPSYDVAPLNPYAVAAMSAAKLILPIDTSKVDHYSDISPALLKQMTQGGNVYAIPFSIGQLGLAYRTDMVSTPPSSWLDLFNSAYKSCGVALLAPNIPGGGPETLSALAKALGGDQADPKTMDKVFETIKAGKDNVVAFPANTADMSTILQRGEACIGPFYDGRAIALNRSGVPLSFVVPKEGSVAAMNGYTIAAGSPHIDLAYKFLSFVADAKSQAAFANKIFYATSNLTTPYDDAFLQSRSNSKPDFDNMIWLDSDLLAQRGTDWQDRWESIFH